MIPTKKGRAIITSSRNLIALVVARSLGRRDIELIGADCIDFTMLSMSKYVAQHERYANPLEDTAAFLDDLEAIVKKHQPEDGRPYLLYPVFTETVLIAQNAHRFEPYIQLACPSWENIRKIHPKQHFAQTTHELQISAPETYLPQQPHELEAIAAESGFPLLIKPYDQTGGKGITKVKNQKELRQAFETNQSTFGDPPVVQELAEGEDYSFTALFQRGELRASMAYKNLTNFPANGGSGVMRETVDATPFLVEARKLLEPLCWHGVAQLDFRWTGEAEKPPQVIEQNPRFWAGLFQSVHSGVDYPWLMYLMYTGQEMPPVPTPQLGERSKLPAVWILSMLRESINLEDSLSSIGEAGQEALQAYREHRSLLHAFGTLFRALRSDIYAPVNGQKLMAEWQLAQNAENEIFSTDDPQASLGITYALVYLAKYRRLPPETAG